MDFGNTQTAFSHKSNRELTFMNWLFSLMNYPAIVNIGGKLAFFSFQWKLPVKGIVKGTIFKHFCGGETIEETKKVIHELGKYNIKTILDYGVEAKESEADFDKTTAYHTKTLNYAAEEEDIHIVSTKLTGLINFGLLEKVTNKESLSDGESAAFERAKNRVHQICKAAYDANISIHIDAEESWIQGAVDEITLEMMALFNKEKPIVFNTLQMYRTDRMDFLKYSLKHANENGYICAVKLVRGAYMEKERRRAAAKGYPSPIHKTIEDTHRDYNNGLQFCIENIDNIYVCNATHNQESCAYLTTLMDEHNLPKNHPHISSAQLYGMSDNLSFNLANAGYLVEKYLPYGPVKEVIPYLIRRTKENSSVGGQMSRELALIKKEIRRRKGKTSVGGW